jgi:hypothetical protein
MNNQLKVEELDQILDAYIIENEAMSKETLKEWIRRYPQYERELMDVTVTLIKMQATPPTNISKDEEDILIQRGISVVHNLLREEQARQQKKSDASYPIQGLVKEANRRNISLDQFANLVDLTPALLAKIDRRLIKYSSIPLQLLGSIASVLDRGVLSIVKYLQPRPTIPKQMRFKAHGTPQVGKQVDFFDEIRKDPELKDDLRQYWLEFEGKQQ